MRRVSDSGGGVPAGRGGAAPGTGSAGGPAPGASADNSPAAGGTAPGTAAGSRPDESALPRLTHADESGRAHMVDTGGKPVQHRTATAAGSISLQPETLRLISENLMKKGDVISVAQIAGIQAAKQCSTLIPLCHNIPLDQVMVTLEPDDEGMTAVATVRSTGRTGVEMEALTAVSTALLTVYDMCKAVDRQMVIGGIRLLKKEKHDVA